MKDDHAGKTEGRVETRRARLSEDVSLVWSDCLPHRALAETSHNPHAQPMLVFTFGLVGESHFISRCGTQTRFLQQHLSVTSFSDCAGERCYRAGERVIQLRLLLSADSAQRYFGAASGDRLFATSRLINHAFTPFSPATASLLSPLVTGPGDALTQHIAALELLAHHRHLLQPEAGAAPHPQDEQRLELARAWMIEHLGESFSLSALALAAGLSEYKLKQGFQRRFNTTPGQMLLKLRMARAQILLEQGYQVGQAAWQVGYRHANNFSVAFQRYTGRSASAVAGKKK